MRTVVISCFILLTTTIGCQKEDITSDSFWEVVNPEDIGWSGDSLTFALRNAENHPNFYSLLVVKDGKIVSEGYFNGKSASDHFHLRSITKSVISLLTGIAIDKGYINGLNQSIKEFFPSEANDNHETITIEHLLTMSSGIEWNEEEEVIDLLERKIKDPVKYFFSREKDDLPGEQFNYSTLSTHVLGQLISRASNMSLEKFAEKYLFDRIGIGSYRWEKDGENNAWGSTGLQLRTRDIARFGLLISNEGRWENEQIVSSSWIWEMTHGQIEINGSGSSYGYQWWIADHLQPHLVFAQGFGGQALMLIPEKNTYIIATQEHYVGFENSSTQWSRFLSGIFWPIFRSIE